MQKVRDSYNCDTIATAAATAALQDQDWMLRNREQIICTRNRMLTELPPLGFSVCPSQANFVWAIHETGRHQQIFELLKRRRILVRFMQFPNAGVNNETLDGLRITVGTDDEVEKLLNAMRQVVAAEC